MITVGGLHGISYSIHTSEWVERGIVLRVQDPEFRGVSILMHPESLQKWRDTGVTDLEIVAFVEAKCQESRPS